MTPRRILKCGKETQKWTTVRGNSLLQERTRIWVFRSVQGKFAAENSLTTRTTRRGGTTSTYLVLTFHISRKSTRICVSQLNRKPEDTKEDLDVNTLIWWMFMTVTLQAAGHLGNDHLENQHSTKNQSQRTVQHLFDVTKKLVRDWKEIQGVSVVDWQQTS